MNFNNKNSIGSAFIQGLKSYLTFTVIVKFFMYIIIL